MQSRPDPPGSPSGDEPVDPFAQLPEIDVIDGELVPRAKGRRRPH